MSPGDMFISHQHAVVILTSTNLFIQIWSSNIFSLKLYDSDECDKYAIGVKVTEVEVLQFVTSLTTTYTHTQTFLGVGVCTQKVQSPTRGAFCQTYATHFTS